MATQAPKDDASRVIGEIIRVRPSEIDQDDAGRIGLFYPAKAEGLAARIREDGQLEPILIARAPAKSPFRWRLVAGLHRLRACILLDRDVEARVVTGTADELRRVQAAENVERRVMSPLERCMFVAAVADAVQRRVSKEHGGRSQQQIAIKARWDTRVNITRVEDALDLADQEAQASAEALSSAYGWRSEVAAACGLSVESLKLSLRIYRRVVEPHRALVDAIKDCAVAENQKALLTLAAQASDVIGKALAWYADHPEAATAEQALVALGASTSKGERAADQQQGATKLMTRADNNVMAMSASEQVQWAPTLAKNIKPSALIAFRDAINARIAAGEAKANG